MGREADYLVFAAEQYRYAKGLTGAQLVELFEKYGVSKFILDSYEFSIVEGIGDEEVPESHCGRYFELKWRKNADDPKIDCGQEMVPVYRGWIGVNYNDSCNRLSKSGGSDKEKQSFGERPAFIIAIAKDFPAANKFDENSWGWKFLEIEMPSVHTTGMESVRKGLLEMCDVG